MTITSNMILSALKQLRKQSKPKTVTPEELFTYKNKELYKMIKKETSKEGEET